MLKAKPRMRSAMKASHVAAEAVELWHQDRTAMGGQAHRLLGLLRNRRQPGSKSGSFMVSVAIAETHTTDKPRNPRH